MVLVAFIQRVIGAFHENLGPLDQRGGEKTGKSADQDFLKEGGVHPFLTAAMVPVGRLFAEDVDLILTPDFSPVLSSRSNGKLFKRFLPRDLLASAR